MSYSDAVCGLRNQERAKYFLKQERNLLKEEQDKWILSYLQNDREIGYIVCNKKSEVVGTFFLYNITGQTLELGRAVFDLNKTHGGPYTVETVRLLIKLVFNCLGIPQIQAHVKEDNSGLLSLLKKFGFRQHGNAEIRGGIYHLLVLDDEAQTYDRFDHTILSWKARGTVGAVL